MLRQADEFDSVSKETGVVILASERFQAWLRAGKSDMIYVEGRGGSYDAVSPTTHFSADLIRLFVDSPATITLHFFCGQHFASNDDLCGPGGLIRSLLAQLLRKWPVAAPIDLDAAFRDQYELTEVEFYLKCFRDLIDQLPTCFTVICVIDDVPKLEKEKYYHLRELVMGELCNVVFELCRRRPLRFKLLMASPMGSNDMKDWLVKGGLDFCLIEVAESGSFMGIDEQHLMWEDAAEFAS